MKLHRYLFGLLVFLLPIQLGRHFWPEWTQVLGLPIDYLSPTIYLTDLLVFVILLFWLIETRSPLRLKKAVDWLKNNWWFLAIFLFLLVNALLAPNKEAAIFKLAKVIEFVFLGFYVFKEQYKINEIILPLSGAIIYSALITLTQFIKQGTVGGLFWWLGERNFSLITPGIAKTIIGGRLILRPYATFPHPNVLAGFILVSMILIGLGIRRQGFRKVITWFALILGGVAIIFSFSRSVWLISILVGLGLVIKNQWQKRRKSVLVIITIISLLLISGFYYQIALPLSGRETVWQRFSLAQVAIKMIRANPLSGIGFNNFIPQLPFYWQQFGTTYWLQPVHNIYLLILAETGFVGLLIFFWLLGLTFRRLLTTSSWQLILALSVVLSLGLFDHYWFTLQQSQLLLAIVFGLSWE
ncbi:MAG TPA: O-antigen ligase family protein [Patescibacteria group bacterium]|nr:O-antigen ligase family protein [Patescibacteria group bacterium]